MKQVKFVIPILIVLSSLVSNQAQSTSSLLGKWKSSYTEEGVTFHVIYEFEMTKDKLVCFTSRIKDDNGEGEPYRSVALENIVFNNGAGKANYKMEYDDKEYTLKSSLKLIDANTLNLKYSYMGFSETERWHRIL